MKIRKNGWYLERLINWFKENKPECIVHIEKLPSKLTKNTHICYTCTICNCENKQTITHLVSRKQSCVRCKGVEQWTFDRFVEWFTDNRKAYILDVNWLKQQLEKNGKINILTIVKYFCIDCGTHGSQILKGVVRKSFGCPVCAGNSRWTVEYLIEWFAINKPKDTLHTDRLSQTLNCYSKIFYTCGDCGTCNESVINNIVNVKTGCPICAYSKGQTLVASILEKLKIDFKSEYPSKHFRPNTRYRFDFALPQYKVIIEFHGQQHYESSSHNFGSKSRTKEELFAIVSRNDKKKQEIVKAAGWYLLELHYDLKKIPAEIERLIVIAIHYNNF